jgi:hypothetical protein
MNPKEEQKTYLEIVVSPEDLQETWLFLENLENASAILNSNSIGEQDDRGLVAKYQAALNIVSENNIKKKLWLNAVVSKYKIPPSAKIEMDTGKVYITA